MKRVVIVVAAVAVLVVPMAAAFALGPGYFGPGPMGHGMMGFGPGSMGPRAGMGWGPCGAAAAGGPQESAITEEKAKEIAQQYADKHLKGYSVERVLPFAGRFATMYSVDLRGPKGETQVVHVNPWGNVMPWGPLARAR